LRGQASSDKLNISKPTHQWRQVEEERDDEQDLLAKVVLDVPNPYSNL